MAMQLAALIMLAGLPQTSSLVAGRGLPLLPNGHQLSISLGSLADCDTGGRLWPSAIVHCQWQATAVEELAGSSILDLGTGTGAVGLYAACLGATRVILSDGGSDALLSLARQNAAANEPLWSIHAADVSVAHLPWGSAAGITSPVDFVFGSDVTYAKSAQAKLCWSIAEQLRLSGGRCQVVLSHEHRVFAGEPIDLRLDAFQSAACEAGLDVSVIQTVVAPGGRNVSLLRVADAARGDGESPPGEGGGSGTSGDRGRREKRISGIGMLVGNEPDEGEPRVPLPAGAFEVRTSNDPARGQGLFATTAIPQGRYLMDYEGEVILEDSIEGLKRAVLSEYSVSVRNTAGVGFVIDAMDPASSNLARYINHAPVASPECNTVLLEQDAMAANMEYAASIRERIAAEMAKGGEAVDRDALIRELLENPEAIPPPRLHISASRPIEAGEELMFDYGDQFWENMAKRGRGAPF